MNGRDDLSINILELLAMAGGCFDSYPRIRNYPRIRERESLHEGGYLRECHTGEQVQGGKGPCAGAPMRILGCLTWVADGILTRCT